MRGLHLLTGRGDSRGFTLVEVILILAVIAVALAFIVPGLAGLIQGDNERATKQQAERVYRAIFGNPARGEFGYLGDMGRLPTTLSELVEQGSQAAFHTANGASENVGGVGIGWRGPYLQSLFSTTDLLKDPWAQPFSYTSSGSTAGQIISGGPDGQVATSGDNITFPLYAPPATGTVFVTVVVNKIPNPLGATAKLYYPVNGGQTVTPTQKYQPVAANQLQTFDGFAFDQVPAGLRVLVVAHTGVGGGQCPTVSRAVNVTVHAGQSVHKEVRMLTDATVQTTGNMQCTIPD